MTYSPEQHKDDSFVYPEIIALAKFLDCDYNDIKRCSYDDDILEAEGGDYLVLTDEQATEKCVENIKDSLWAFNADFILRECGLPRTLENAIKAMQEKECESCNETILEMLEATNCTVEEFAEAAISADGRGHFLSSYDGEENESDSYFIYRTN